jgi:hypothetical protein
MISFPPDYQEPPRLVWSLIFIAMAEQILSLATASDPDISVPV